MGMASVIQKGESLYIPFRDGHSIADSQLKPRMYKTPEAFQQKFPGYYLGTKDAVNFHKMCKITLEKTKRWQQRLTNAVSEE